MVKDNVYRGIIFVQSIEMEEMSAIANTEINNAPAAKNQPEFENRTIVEIPAQDIINAIESTSDGMSPMRRASYDSYEETTIVVPIAVVQRRPSLVATMDAERQERLRKEEKRKQLLMKVKGCTFLFHFPVKFLIQNTAEK